MISLNNSLEGFIVALLPIILISLFFELMISVILLSVYLFDGISLKTFLTIIIALIIIFLILFLVEVLLIIISFFRRNKSNSNDKKEKYKTYNSDKNDLYNLLKRKEI